MKLLRVLVVIVFTFFLANCGGGGGSSNSSTTTPTTPTPPSVPSITGNWAISAVSSVVTQTTQVGGSLVSNGTQITGVVHVLNSACYTLLQDVSVTGTITAGSNAFTLTSNAVSSQVITVSGTFSSAGNSFSGGTYSITGGCAGGDHGTVSGFIAPTFTNTYAGSFASNSGPVIGVSVSTTQSANPDSDGLFHVAGTVTFQNSPCFTSASISSSAVAGQYFEVQLTTNNGAVLTFVGDITDSTGKTISGTYQVMSGTCAGDAGSGTISLGAPSASISISPTSATVVTTKTQQFTSTVTSSSSNTAVTWEVNNIVGGNSSLGTISTTGLYTAPNTVPNPATVTVTAVSQANPTVSASSTVTVTAPTPVNNSAQLIVDAGPPAAVSAGAADNNIAFTTVTLCVPGTSTCQTIDHVQVDTGSEGLRLPTGVLTVSLPQQTTFECLGFADGTFIWGPLATADIQIAGEVAHSVPIQLASAAAPPASAGNSGCSGAGQIASVPAFGANGILGLGVFRQDCGGGCTTSASNSIYFGPNCASGTCNPVAQSLAAQLQNPVWMFPRDNNGIILQLPTISANGQVNATGSLVFGIGTQSDNGIGSASAIVPDPNTGNFAANFKGVLYNDVTAKGSGGTGGAAFIDSGSNGLFFLDSATLTNQFGISMPNCPSSGANALPGFYCPGGLTTITGGSGGLTVCSESSNCIAAASGRAVTLNVQNGQSLIFSPNTAFDDLGGSSPFTFDLGLPFFFGQNIYIGIEGQSTPLGTGPLYAF